MCSTHKTHAFIKSYDTQIVISDNNNKPNKKNRKLLKFREKRIGLGGLGEKGLVWDGGLASGFFDDRQDLLEFAEVFEYCYASLCDCEDCAGFADCAFFD
jgi:hypothetical protein